MTTTASVTETRSNPERAIRRVLNSLYQRTGVANRDQAVAWAGGNSLLTDDLDA